jgi:RNA polymerase sigma-70 factor (ECF subfamily)
MGAPSIVRAELGRLYQRYGAAVLRQARRLLGDEPLARDVCQDVFVEILQARPTWNPPSPVGWLHTTTTNKCLNLLRRRQRLDRLLRDQDRASSGSPELSVSLLLKNLPEELQEIAVYYGIDEMSQDEIAALLGISQKTVSNRLQQIRAKLERAGWCRRVEAT